MKIKLLIAFCLMLNIAYAGPTIKGNFDKTSVTITDNKNSYQFEAEFNPDKTKRVRGIMDDYLKGGPSFKNTEVDAVMTLDDKTTFYIKSAPGKLTLKVDKRKNSAEVYQRFKTMCGKIRDAIGDNK